MKSALALLMCFLSFELQSLVYEQQFDNEQICIGKLELSPQEATGLHRDEYPHVVIALKGGTITRHEVDGREVEVDFPTGKTIFREADIGNVLHRSVNNSSESVELIVIQLKNSALKKSGSNSHDIAIGIKVRCPMSSELQDFVKSIPPVGNYSSSFEEWKSSFINNMTQLIRLIESGKVNESFWSVKTDLLEVKEN